MKSASVLTALVLSAAFASAQTPKSSSLLENGKALFQQNCAFCHGRDAGGGETGPDLTRSELVAKDVAGNKISLVVRNGIPEKGMPKFALPDNDIAALVAFVHEAKFKADAQKGGRRGVDVSDLQTGNAEAGERYFQGTGGCAGCHSGTGDLAGIASRHKGLDLEQRLLYPHDAVAKVTVMLPNGETVQGKLAHSDEFVVALRDANGRYRSWSVDRVKVTVDDPAKAHVDLLAKYSDDDIHNLMAYLQTLR